MKNEFFLVIATPPPSVNGCHGHVGKRRYKTAKYKDWQQYVWKHLEEEHNIKIEHVLPNRKNARTKKHKIMGGKTLIGQKPFKLRLRQTFKSKRRRDIDNYLKPLLDTLEGIIFDNDSQLEKLTVIKKTGCEFDEFELRFTF